MSGVLLSFFFRLLSPAADFLKQRTFQGLEQRLGEDMASILEQGRSGIAKGYLDDHILPEDIPERSIQSTTRQTHAG